MDATATGHIVKIVFSDEDGPHVEDAQGGTIWGKCIKIYCTKAVARELKNQLLNCKLED